MTVGVFVYFSPIGKEVKIRLSTGSVRTLECVPFWSLVGALAAGARRDERLRGVRRRLVRRLTRTAAGKE